MITMDVLDGPGPKRGDLVQTNVGDKRERTWLVINSHKIREGRYKVLMGRWWELEVEMRVNLARSAERNGGQRVFTFQRYKPRRKPASKRYEKW
jgi:hypothetical protein